MSHWGCGKTWEGGKSVRVRGPETLNQQMTQMYGHPQIVIRAPFPKPMTIEGENNHESRCLRRFGIASGCSV
jgi:hypothetical protein